MGVSQVDFVIVIAAFVAFACVVAPVVALGVVALMGVREDRRRPARQSGPPRGGHPEFSTGVQKVK
jgi:hypothetical protein